MITLQKNGVTHEVNVTCISSILGRLDTSNKIGYDNNLLIRNRADLQHFKETTIGRFVCMGRNTFDSLDGKILSDRVNFILTRDYNRQEIIGKLFIDINMDSNKSQTKVIAGNQDLLYHYLWDNQISDMYVIGGEQIFAEFFPCADISIISFFEIENITANRFFPKIGPEWIERKTTIVHREPFKISYLYNTKKPNRLVNL